MLNEFIQRLMMLRQFSMEDTRITLFRQDQMLLDTDFVVKMQELAPEKFYQTVKANAKEKLAAYTKVFGSSPESVSEDTLKRLFGSLGFGSLEILQLNRTEKRVFFRLDDSPIVAAYKRLKIKKSAPACTFISGVLAGAFSAIFQKDVNCKETGCALKPGEKKCNFIVE